MHQDNHAGRRHGRLASSQLIIWRSLNFDAHRRCRKQESKAFLC